MVVAAAMQPLVLDDAARREALAKPDVAAPLHEIEFRAGKRQRAEADVLAAAREHRLHGNVMLDDLELGPARHALMVHRRAPGEQRGKDGEGSSHPRNSLGARVAALERGAGPFGAGPFGASGG